MDYKTREPKVGEHVIHIDPVGVEHDALVTNVFSKQCINLVFVSGDNARQDGYGRQVERCSSHQRLTSDRGARGNSWRFPGEDTPPTTAELHGWATTQA